MTRHEIKVRFPEASESFVKANLDPDPAGICPSDKESAKRGALVSRIQREEKGRARATIVFTVFAVRPADWDGYSIKQIQDCLVHAGLLDGDDWDQLEGCVRSRKVHTKKEEKTTIEIWA